MLRGATKSRKGEPSRQPVSGNKRWTKIGAAFPHKEGQGFSIELQAFPVDGCGSAPRSVIISVPA
jgi:hypothetical protein